jgi:hypothetical protein
MANTDGVPPGLRGSVEGIVCVREPEPYYDITIKNNNGSIAQILKAMNNTPAFAQIADRAVCQHMTVDAILSPGSDTQVYSFISWGYHVPAAVVAGVRPLMYMPVLADQVHTFASPSRAAPPAEQSTVQW